MKKINPIISEILIKRGIKTETEMTEFLSDKPMKTYDPFLLDGVRTGVDLILSEIENGSSICIYGDYDADGITSIGILYQVLSELTDKLSYYIPSRTDEGYGLNKRALKSIKDSGADLVITVDCGSTSYGEIKYACGIGLKLLVTDHHNIESDSEDCIIINPKKENSRYPFNSLAGCGVAFKLAQGLQRTARLPKCILNNVLDLVAIGTIGDVVPLIDENRTLAKHGINSIRKTGRPGLRYLIERISYSVDSLDSWQITFGVVPSLNATGRVASADLGLELMLTNDQIRAQELTDKVIECNLYRKSIQEEAYNKCVGIVEEKLKDDLFIIIEADEVHEGVAGIVAGKIKDLYHRPTVIILKSGNMLKGTGRSIGNVDMHGTLKKFENLFEKFGGHRGACGFSIKSENIEALKMGLKGEMARQLSDDSELFASPEEIDFILNGSDITLELAREIDKLSPFGCRNPEPVFMLKKIKAVEFCLMGNDNQHVRFNALCPDGASVKCVLFNRARDYRTVLYQEQPVDLIGTIKWQEWRGKLKVQFVVDDIRG